MPLAWALEKGYPPCHASARVTFLRAAAPALAAIITLVALPAAAQEVGGTNGDDFGEGLGTVAAWLLGITGGIAVWNLARRRWVLGWLRASGRRHWIKPAMQVHRTWLMPMHGVAGTASLAFGLWHATRMEEHWILWTAMVGMGFLTVGGALLQWKWTPSKVRKGVYLLHAQQLIFLGVLGLLVLGHALVD